MSTPHPTDATIARALPRPIAVVWSATAAGTSPVDRATRLYRMLECTLQVVGSVALADALTHGVPDKLADLVEGGQNWSLGTRAHVLQEALRAIRDRDAPPFSPEAVAWWFDGKGPSANARLVSQLVSQRNRFTHPKGHLVEAHFDPARVDALHDDLCALLDSLSWLSAHPLFRVVDTELLSGGMLRGTAELLVGEARVGPRRTITWPAQVPLLANRVFVASPCGTRVLDVGHLLGVSAHGDLHVLDRFHRGAPRLVDPITGGDLPTDALPAPEDGAAFGGPAVLELASPLRLVPPRLTDGQVLDDRFRLVRRLGRRALAEVWQAEDLQRGAPVALKVLHAAASDDPELRRRFARESAALRSIVHPRVLSGDSVPLLDGRLALATPLMPGGALSDHVRPDGQPARKVRRWAEQALEGLVAVHAAGIVHRDVRPSNLLLDTDGRVVVAGFGRCRRLSDASLPVVPSDHAPPEPRDGPKADVYALAVALHALRTGQVPRTAPGDGVDGALGGLLRRMGASTPEARPTAAEALAVLRPPKPRAGRVLALVTSLGLGAAALFGGFGLGAVGIGVAHLADDASDVRAAVAPDLPEPVRRDPVEHPVLGALAWVPPGTFTMGSPPSEPGRLNDERPHAVRITRPLWVSATEVTRSAWHAVTGTRPWRGRTHDGERCGAWGRGPNAPATCVTWHEAIDFANALSEREKLTPAYRIDGRRVTFDPGADGYRLPTEAEWEYVARAGTVGRFGPTDDAMALCEVANGLDSRAMDLLRRGGPPVPCGDDHVRLAPVGRFAPNPWGLHDTVGNAREWTWDAMGPYPSDAVSDPIGPPSGRYRVVRGGSAIDGPRALRVARRGQRDPASYHPVVGFRVVRPVR